MHLCFFYAHYHECFMYAYLRLMIPLFYYGMPMKEWNHSLRACKISNLIKIEPIHAHLFIRKPEVAGATMITLKCLVKVLLRIFISHAYLLCCLQRRSMGSVVIFVEFPTWHWHFDLILNAIVMMAHAAIWVYIFYDRQFGASMMSPSFRPTIFLMTLFYLLHILYFIPLWTYQI